MSQSIANPNRRRARTGFSLVELLVVIAIIVLLISIVVPALSAARNAAKEASTNSMLGVLSIGLQTFEADRRIGGRFPPSLPDLLSNGGRTAANPYERLTGGSTPIEISGAGLLVWSLAGADLLGSPGFRTFNSGSSVWNEDTMAATGSGGAYELDQQTLLALRARSGPYVDLSKIKVTSWDAEADTRSGLGSFEIEAEREAAESLGQKPEERLYPMFLDSFGYPVLYWRADPAGVRFADEDLDRLRSPALRGRYHWIDNDELVASGSRDVLVLRADNEVHKLDWEQVPDRPGIKFTPGFFQYYIQNQDVQAKNYPHRGDSYLLVSPGADGLYGTADDIANFDHGGR